MGNLTLKGHMIEDGLTCASNHYHMGLLPKILQNNMVLAAKHKMNSALRSQTLASQAVQLGVFDKEIIPVMVKNS